MRVGGGQPCPHGIVLTQAVCYECLGRDDGNVIDDVVDRLEADKATLQAQLSEAQREIEYQKSAMVHARSRVDALSAALATYRARGERLRQLVEEWRKLADDADARKRENDDSNVLKAVYWAREARTYRARADELSALLADPIPTADVSGTPSQLDRRGE